MLMFEQVPLVPDLDIDIIDPVSPTVTMEIHSKGNGTKSWVSNDSGDRLAYPVNNFVSTGNGMASVISTDTSGREVQESSLAEFLNIALSPSSRSTIDVGSAAEQVSFAAQGFAEESSRVAVNHSDQRNPPILPAPEALPGMPRATDYKLTVNTMSASESAVPAAKDMPTAGTTSGSRSAGTLRKKTKGGRSERLEKQQLRKVIATAKVKKIGASACKSTKPVRLTIDQISKTGILPPDHKPARGRGRQIQLQSMTDEQIKAEALARLAKNRDAARETRHARKQRVLELEKQVDELAAREAEAQRNIEQLREVIRRYEERHGPLE